MNAIDTLSLVANGAGIVGLADVVLKRSTELYDLYSRCKGASESRTRLLAEIQGSADIAVRARSLLDDLQASGISSQEGHCLAEITSILGRFNQEFDVLSRLVTSARVSAGDGLVARVTRSLRWTMNEPAVAQACGQLHSLTASLTAALAVAGGYNGIVIHREITQTRTQVMAQLAQTTQSWREEIQTLLLVPGPTSVEGRRRPPSAHPGIIHRQKKRSRGKTRYHVTATNSTGERSRAGALPAGPTTTQEALLETESCVARWELIRLLERENDTVAVMAPVEEDVTVSLVLMKDSLLEAIGSSVGLIIPDHVATFVAGILDEVLVQAHLSSANRLRKRQRGPTPAPALTSGLPGPGNVVGTSSGSDRLGPWMSTFVFEKPDDSYSKTPVPRSAAETGDVWCLVQEMTRQTSAGPIRATLIQGGNRLVSKVLYFNVAFQPRNGGCGSCVTLEFVSLWFQMMSLPCPSIKQSAWKLSSSDCPQSWTIAVIVKQPDRSCSKTITPLTAAETGVLWCLVQRMMRQTLTRLTCTTLIKGGDR
ncbi:hypothetical protein QIS74_11313 [Colletotrichum tabaci]|uniref:Fungal N-terminal domain-containing protein n=1 Tax=Colletotrichum tabaci TaxID=1209068 RepID=A0AAV9SYT0_9PEZI